LRKRGLTKKVRAEGVKEFLHKLFSGGVDREKAFFLCVGTDRSSGDALGPLVGTMLVERGLQRVCGTLDNPCDSSNLPMRLEEIPEDAVVIAIDACLGQQDSVGWYLISDGPLQPGKSVGKQLPSVGHYSIAAVVNTAEGRTYAMLQTTSLHLVLRMAREIADAITEVYIGNARDGQS
jgi:putative sporulation protein YyaC